MGTDANGARSFTTDGSPIRRNAGPTLNDMVANWATSVANDDNKSPEAHMAMKARMKGGPRNTVTSLQVQAKMWATPAPMQTREGWTPEQIEAARAKERAKGQNGNGFGIGLAAQATMWTTPQAHDATMRGAGQVPTSKAGNACLARDATQWPTPAARDHKGANGTDHLSNGTGRLHLDQLPNFVAHSFTRPDPETVTHGVSYSELLRIWRRLRASVIASHGRVTWRRMWKARTARRLNPLFVEWLMGWPPGHALCACSATEYIRWQQDMRFALSQLPTACGPWIWKEPEPQAEELKQASFW